MPDFTKLRCDLPMPDGSTRPATLTLPAGEGPFPGVVVIHDIFGIREDTGRHCERFAAEGYAAIAPDLYNGWRPPCVVKTLLSSLKTHGEGLDVVASARRVLAARAEVDEARIGVIGFCLGGGFALLSAAQDAYAVAAPFYGMVPKRTDALSGICPVLAQFGEKDMPFRSSAARLGQHLKTLGVTHEVLVHEGAGHGFMNDHKDPLFYLGRFTPMRARFDPQVYESSWRRMLDFFERHMGEAAPSAQ